MCSTDTFMFYAACAEFCFISPTRHYEMLILLCVLGIETTFAFPKVGHCPNITVMQKFSLNKYLGLWFEQSTYNTPHQNDLKCVLGVYLNASHNMASFQHMGITKSGEWSNGNGSIRFSDPTDAKKEAKLIITYGHDNATAGPYWVLDTDYDTYAVVYSCTNHLLLFHSYEVWILSRKQTFSSPNERKEFKKKIQKVLKNHHLSTQGFKKTNQEDCKTKNM